MGNSAPSSIQNTLNEHDWMHLIQQSRKQKFDANEDYELLIQYLVNPQTTSNDIVSSIARIIRYYISKISGVTLCDFGNIDGDDIKFDGVKASVAIHPINGDVYVADEHKIFKLIKTNTLNIIAKIPETYMLRERPRITDLCFNADGKGLFCMFDNDLNSVYWIDHNDGKIVDSVYDKMNIFQYDFNHYYLTDSLISKIFPNIETTKHLETMPQSRIWSYGSLYVPNCYKNEIWVLQNNGKQQSPFLYNIAMDKKKTILDKIDLYDIENFRDKISVSNENKYVVAFDVDKYYGAIYIVTNTKTLYRIEKLNKEWKITHKVSLQDVLENNLPVGIHTIRYDSIIGRIIIADNYKIQSVYL